MSNFVNKTKRKKLLKGLYNDKMLKACICNEQKSKIPHSNQRCGRAVNNFHFHNKLFLHKNPSVTNSTMITNLRSLIKHRFQIFKSTEKAGVKFNDLFL